MMFDIALWVLGYTAIGAAWAAMDALYGIMRGEECFGGSIRGGLIWPFTMMLLVILGIVAGVLLVVRFISKQRKEA